MDNNLEKVERRDMAPPELAEAPVPELWARAMRTPEELAGESLGEVRDVQSGEIERIGQFEQEKTGDRIDSAEQAKNLDRGQAAMMGGALLGVASEQETQIGEQNEAAQGIGSGMTLAAEDEMPENSKDGDKLDKTWFEAVDKVVKKYDDDPYELVQQLQDGQKKFLLQRYGRTVGKQPLDSNLQGKKS